MALRAPPPAACRRPPCLVLLALFLAAPAAGVEEPDLAASLRALEGHPVDEIWPAVEALKTTHQGDAGAMHALARDVHSLTGKTKLAGAAILLARKEPALAQGGQIALQQLARGAGDRSVRVAALRLLRKPILFEPAYLTLNEVAQSARGERDVEVSIEATLSLWELDNHPSIREPLRKLLADPSTETRLAAAVALAETGDYQEPVAEILRGLAREPSTRGRHARALLRATNRDDPPPPAAHPQPRPDRGTNGEGEPEPPAADWQGLLAQIQAMILDNSLVRDRLTRRELYLAAIRGMVSMLDEYSVFQDPAEVRQIDAGRLGTYFGLCADLVKPGRASPLVVARAHRGGPAHQAGLRAGDRIHEVNGVPTADLDRADLAAVTAGETQGEVLLLVSRPAWAERRIVPVQRGTLKIPLIESRLLPERIGYVKLTRVGPTGGADFEAVLDGLEAQGLRALVLDLRDNPGGNVKQAVRIVDLFVGASDLPILSEIGPRQIQRFAGPDVRPQHPMVILVNRQTASAAEVIAGALQDFGRARLVGELTFGKGVKQVSLTLPRIFEPLLGGESRLLVTSGRLFLPSGRPIQAARSRGAPAPGGIEPDVRIDLGDSVYHGRQQAEMLRVQYSEELTTYVHQRTGDLRQAFAGGKLPPAEDLPGLDELHASLGTTLSKGDVRYAVRALVERTVEENADEVIAGNFRDDPALARAILEVLRDLRIDPLASSEYRVLVDAGPPPPPSGND